MTNILPKTEHSGSIYFWKYKLDGWLGSEWHFTADTAGCDFLIRLFDQMRNAEFTCESVITVSPVTQEILRVPDYDSPYKDMSVLRLAYQPFSANYYDWSIIDNRNSVEILFGKAMLAEWNRAVVDVKNGNGSYSIGLNEDHTVFVWWMP